MKDITPHINGSYTTDKGSIINIHTGHIIEEPAILLDTETGTILKIGNSENITQHLNLKKVYNIYEQLGDTHMRHPSSYLQIITFGDKNLTIDQICTLLNYEQAHLDELKQSGALRQMLNSASGVINSNHNTNSQQKPTSNLLSMNEDDLVETLDKLYTAGW